MVKNSSAYVAKQWGNRVQSQAAQSEIRNASLNLPVIPSYSGDLNTVVLPFLGMHSRLVSGQGCNFHHSECA